MEMFETLEAFASLSQETRLKVFRLLLEYGKRGVLAGQIAAELGIPDNTLSFHLAHLTRAKLVGFKKEGRTITYFANTEQIEELIQYLHQNCCAREVEGDAALSSRCQTQKKGKKK